MARLHTRYVLAPIMLWNNYHANASRYGCPHSQRSVMDTITVGDARLLAMVEKMRLDLAARRARMCKPAMFGFALTKLDEGESDE